MKLFELLLEREMAAVYRNEDKSLSVISDLVHREFKLSYKGSAQGICLITQAIYTISAVTGIPAQDLADSYKGDVPYKGLSLPEIYNHFKRAVVTSKRKKYKIKLNLEEYHSTDMVIKHIDDGQPVVMIVDSMDRIVDAIQDTEDDYNQKTGGKVKRTGISKSFPLRHDRPYFHALLLIGVDHKEKFLIGRESSPKGAYGGFFKLHVPTLQKHFNVAKYLGIVVDKVEEVK